MNSDLSTDDFDYDLPHELIAKQPPAERDASRLLVMHRSNDMLKDCRFRDIVNWIEAGDCIVLNDTKVFPARLFANKDTGGKVEILAERIESRHMVKVQLRTNRTASVGTRLVLEDNISAEVVAREGDFFVLAFSADISALEIFQRYGHTPLPPYIERADNEQDQLRYQTVFADQIGAVAAPTAGLHFTQDILDQLSLAGVSIAKITLHVGAGTFKPVKVDAVSEHKMHAEFAHVSEQVCEQIKQTKSAGKRVYAIGTTCVRALETAAQNGTIEPFMGDTDIFIYPGYKFKVVDALLTNFHLPRSTLLMLISALAGRARVMRAYEHAVAQRYRFFSYGDAMLITDVNHQ